MQIKNLLVYQSFFDRFRFFSIVIFEFSFFDLELFWIPRFWLERPESSDESSASSPLIPIPISHFQETTVTKSIMFTLMSDPFSFMVALAGSWGSLHTVPHEFSDEFPRIFSYWRELTVIFMAIFGIVWKYRKNIFFKKIKKNKKIYPKRAHTKKVNGKKIYYKKLYYKKHYPKLNKRKVTFKEWIGEWFG